MVRLRAHHLLCLLTYVGRGYSPAFTANMNLIAERLGAGFDDILLVRGRDDICTPLCGTADDHCEGESALERDAKAAAEISRSLDIDIAIGTVLPAGTLSLLRSAFADGAIRTACLHCPWADLCTAVAASGFAETRLTASARA